MCTYSCKYVQLQDQICAAVAENLLPIINVCPSHLVSLQDGAFTSAEVIQTLACRMVAKTAECLKLSGGNHAVATFKDIVDDALHQFFVVHLAVATRVAHLMEAPHTISNGKEEILVRREVDGVEIDIFRRRFRS